MYHGTLTTKSGTFAELFVQIVLTPNYSYTKCCMVESEEEPGMLYFGIGPYDAETLPPRLLELVEHFLEDARDKARENDRDSTFDEEEILEQFKAARYCPKVRALYFPEMTDDMIIEIDIPH
jgi:hypothetical protein